MLFYENLDKIVFTRNQLLKCDELIVLSGYIGPTPIKELGKLNIKSTVIYGMYGSDGIQQSLHDALCVENNTQTNVEVLYSTIPIHSKCYIWKYCGEVISALVGSANFSINGLTTPFKEVLADATSDTFDPLNKYLDKVLNNTIKCNDAVVSKNKHRIHFTNEDTETNIYDTEVCSMPLYILENGKPVVPAQSGINWGMAKLNGSHVNINDAYIRIGTDLLEHYPNLFPQKQKSPSEGTEIKRVGHRHNDNIEILWDDGTSMIGLLEGSVSRVVNGKKELFPKQIATSPSKALLGKYLRKRLGIPEGKAITYQDLQAYGRTTIDVSLQGEGIYYFDFSVSKTSVQFDIHGKYENNKNNLLVAESSPQYGTKARNIFPKEELIEGNKVVHNEYGTGVIIRKRKEVITISFDRKKMKFNYPEDFSEIKLLS